MARRVLAAVQLRSGFASLTGGRLYYEIAGDGDPVVLIHGNAGDRRHWDHQIEILARGFGAVRYDVRGCGRSSLPDEGQSFSHHEDLAALMDHLGIPSAHLVGWSMGSGIAVDFALAYPDQTASLVSVGPWVNGYASPAAQALSADLAQVGAVMAQGGPAAAVRAWMDAPFFAATIRDPAAGAEFRRIAEDYSFWAFSHRNPARALAPPSSGRLAEIQVPTLVLTAEYDIPACLEIADLLDTSVRDSRKVAMDGTGHLLHIERPQEFCERLVHFLTGVARHPGARPGLSQR
ncbi:MAG: alpha/beta hydrolase [Candidatus Latescibacterota bacterium]